MVEKVQNNNDTRRDLPRVDRGNFDRGGRLVGPVRPQEKSPFEQLLDQTTQQIDPFFGGLQNPHATKTATQEAVRAVVPQKERFSQKEGKDDFEKKSKEKETDREELKTGSTHGAEVPRAKVAEKRVIGRGSAEGEGHSGGGQKGGQGQSSLGQEGREKRGPKLFFSPAPDLKTGPRRASFQDAVRNQFQLETQMARIAANTVVEKPKTPQVLSKAALDQMVRYCRLVTKVGGDKEIDMQLHEEVYKGLRLRVSLVKGKIAATFLTESRDVRDLFLAQRGEIQKALSEKGIEVGAIEVTMV